MTQLVIRDEDDRLIGKLDFDEPAKIKLYLADESGDEKEQVEFAVPEPKKVESRPIRLHLCEMQYRKFHDAYHIIATWATLPGHHAAEFYIKELTVNEATNFVKFLGDDMSKLIQYYGTRYSLQNDMSVPLYLKVEKHNSGVGYEMNVYWTPKGGTHRYCVSCYGANLLSVRSWIRRVLHGQDLTQFRRVEDGTP